MHIILSGNLQTLFTGHADMHALSFTGRADMSTGILRQHDAGTLGFSNHTPTPYLFNLMYNSLLFT